MRPCCDEGKRRRVCVCACRVLSGSVVWVRVAARRGSEAESYHIFFLLADYV